MLPHDMSTRPLTIATLNLLSDLTYWNERAPLILQGFRELDPDVICLQEVAMPLNNAQWLASRLGGYDVFLCPRTGPRGLTEASALLCRLPVQEHETLAFGQQGRVAQRIVISRDGKPWTIANAHLYFSLMDDEIRVRHAHQLLQWLAHHHPVVLCGDMNALPHYRAMAALRERFVSAHAAAHGHEPRHTFPTALRRGPGLRHLARNTGLRLLGLAAMHRNDVWRGTLDYIFIDPHISVLECITIMDKPAPNDPHLYPSDHTGLAARLLSP